jgi:hypothetical protein
MNGDPAAVANGGDGGGGGGNGGGVVYHLQSSAVDEDLSPLTMMVLAPVDTTTGEHIGSRYDKHWLVGCCCMRRQQF